jgi:hypothetical protein
MNPLLFDSESTILPHTNIAMAALAELQAQEKTHQFKFGRA